MIRSAGAPLNRIQVLAVVAEHLIIALDDVAIVPLARHVLLILKHLDV